MVNDKNKATQEDSSIPEQIIYLNNSLPVKNFKIPDNQVRNIIKEAFSKIWEEGYKDWDTWYEEEHFIMFCEGWDHCIRHMQSFKSTNIS